MAGWCGRADAEGREGAFGGMKAHLLRCGLEVSKPLRFRPRVPANSMHLDVRAMPTAGAWMSLVRSPLDQCHEHRLVYLHLHSIVKHSSPAPASAWQSQIRVPQVPVYKRTFATIRGDDVSQTNADKSFVVPFRGK